MWCLLHQIGFTGTMSRFVLSDLQTDGEKSRVESSTIQYNIEDLVWRAACNSISSILNGENVICMKFERGVHCTESSAQECGGMRALSIFNACRILDKSKSGTISYDKFSVIVTGVGKMTILQVTTYFRVPYLDILWFTFLSRQALLLIQRMKTLSEPGEGCLYNALLIGRLKVEGLSYDGLFVRAWLALEIHWEEVAEHFQRFDRDFNGKVISVEYYI